MVKEGLMKKLLVLSLVFACMTGNAQVPADSVVMTVAGKQIPLDEFIFIAQKNSEVNLSDRKSVNAYVELFKNFLARQVLSAQHFFYLGLTAEEVFFSQTEMLGIKTKFRQQTFSG